MSAIVPPRQTVWITGAGGLIGSYFVRTAAQYAPGWLAQGLTRNQLDLTDYPTVRRLFQQEKPSRLIHCAALTSTPVCQQQPALAHRLNVEVTACLAELAAEIPFYFFSSDLVFDGHRGNYDESATPNPLSVYAETKLAAEQIVLKNPRHTVIRTSLNYGHSPTGDHAFNEQIRLAWQAGQILRLFTDEFRCPIPAAVTAQALWVLAGLNQPGLYHLAGSARLSRWQIGQLLAARWPQLNPQLEPVSLRDFQGAARSPDPSLNCAKIQRLLPFRLPGLAEWLAVNADEPLT